jgi:hypothetical protein
MENAALIGLSRQMAIGRELEVVANNIANINTIGYKADSAVFEEYLSPVASHGHFAGRDRRMSYVSTVRPFTISSRVPCFRPTIRSTSPSMVTRFSSWGPRTAIVTPATAPSRSTPPASW